MSGDVYVCGISQRASRLAYRTYPYRIIITPLTIIPYSFLYVEIYYQPAHHQDSLFLIEQELDNVYLPPFAPCPFSLHIVSADFTGPSHLLHCLPPSKFRGEDIPYRPSCSGGGTDTYLGWHRYDSLFLGD